MLTIVYVFMIAVGIISHHVQVGSVSGESVTLEFSGNELNNNGIYTSIANNYSDIAYTDLASSKKVNIFTIINAGYSASF